MNLVKEWSHSPSLFQWLSESRRISPGIPWVVSLLLVRGWVIHVKKKTFSFRYFLPVETTALSKKKNVYVSRYVGNDTNDCGTMFTPCKTLKRGVETAVRDNARRIFMNGTFTCERDTANNSRIKEESVITVNISLEIFSFLSPARVACGDLLQFVAAQFNPKMEVTFTGIVFYNTSMTFIESSVYFVNCCILYSVNPINIILSGIRQTATVSVTNSSFYYNTGCIRLRVSKPGALITITLVSVDFQQNQPLSQCEGSGLTIQGTSTASNQARINISCYSTTFSGNIGPLIANNVVFSKTYEYYHHVKFFKTSARLSSFSSDSAAYLSMAKFAVIHFNDLLCTDNVNTRCIHIDSSQASLRVLNSNIYGHNLCTQFGAGIFIEADSSINVFVNGTTLQRNKGGNGGAIAIRSLSADIHLIISNCYVLNNSALEYGGALFVTTPNGLATIEVENTTLEHSWALENGGAFYITSNKASIINAYNSSWAYNKANAGAAIFVSSATRDQKKTNLNVSAKIQKCQFMSNRNTVAAYASVLFKAKIGHIDVFETEWIKDANCFSIKCNCAVNLTKVNISSTFHTAVEINSSDNMLDDTPMKVNFERCIFHSNKGDHVVVTVSKSLYLHLVLNYVQIDGKKMLAKGIKSVISIYVGSESAKGSTIRLHNVLVNNAIGAASVIFTIENNATNTVEISDSVFRGIKSINSDKYHTTASPISFVMQNDGCNESACNSPYLRFLYRNEIVIRNTTFNNNIGRASGGIFLSSGNMTICNSRFENNYAITRGGHIHVEDGTAMIKIKDSILIQESPETVHDGETFTHDTSIYSESEGSFVLQGTLVTANLEKDLYRLFTVSNGGLVSFDNMTKLQCATGSFLRFDNYSHFTILTGMPASAGKCKFITTVMTLSCYSCPPGSYSLKGGELRGLPEKEKLQQEGDSFCKPCPYGANCSRNVFAEPNFWGYPDSSKPGSLKFAHCPPNYCTPTGKQGKNLSVYNICYGNRDGVMCGRCKEGYTETLFRTKCKQNEKCKDHWIWPVMLIYAVAMALFLIHQPPIVQMLVKNILWFRRVSPNRADYESLDEQTKFNSGYIKIIFYFYQIASYLAVEPLSEVIKNVRLVSFCSGLLNFRPRINSEGFGCPLPGMNVVTKELFLSLGVFATLLSILAILVLHLAFNKSTNRPYPSTAPYVAATLETLLLGYATLANTSLKLLTCVPVLGESRLYYDGNVQCLQWWQYIFIVYIFAFLLPFVIVIYWGAMKLRRKLITVEHFIGACFFPLGFISFWLIQKLACPQTYHQMPSLTNRRRQKVLKVLHDPFRPPNPRQSFGALYWESILIGRRFLLVSYQVFLPDPLLRLFCMDVTCLLIFAWHVAVKPFRDRKANVIEAASLAVLVVIATINLVQAVFLSATIAPNGPVKSHLITLEQVETFLLAVVPVLFSLLCVFAILSQLVRIFVLLLQFLHGVCRRICTYIVLHRLRSQISL